MDWGNCVINGVPSLSCVPTVFSNVIRAALVFAGVIALIFLIFAGIKFVTSGGDPKQVEGARKTMTWALIGLVVIFLSFFIIAVIGKITGVSCINSFGFGQCQ